jgi:hypothetical protein
MYRPYPIYDMKAGKVTKRDPWLLPQDAFETLRNCSLRDGVLEKRRGYVFVGQIVHVNTATKAPTLKSDPVMGVFNYLSAAAVENLIVMDAVRINKYETLTQVGKVVTGVADAGGGDIRLTTETTHGFSVDDIVTNSGFTDSNYNGTFSVKAVNAGNKTYDVTATYGATGTGAVSQEQFNDLTENKIRFKHASKQNWSPSVDDTIKGGTSSATADVAAVIVDSGAFADNDACGTIILKKGSVSGGPFTDGEELQEDGTASNKVGNADGANTDDEFTGDNTNYFWVENWNGTSYITNNYDVLQKYNGSHLTRLHIDLDVEGGPDNDVTRCKFIVQMKNRIVLFDTTETGDGTCSQRARWCDSADPATWPSDSYIDADTDQEMRGAKFVGNDLIVWFSNQVWKFSYTGDPDAPFRWDRIDSERGCYSGPNSLLSLGDEVLVPGQTSINGCDGRDAYEADLKIPDFLLTWDSDSIEYCQALKIKEERIGIISYASDDATANADGNTYPDSCLVYNYEDKGFSTFSLPIHTLGSSKIELELTWLDVTDSWTESDWAWSAKTNQAGYPTSLMGSQYGKVYKLNDGGSDDGSAIEFQAISGRWNPYFSDATAIQTKTITCTSVDGSEEKAIHCVYVNAIAAFHRIELTNNAVSQRLRCHAIVPYFERAGKIR